jgi:hypothetical protein
MLVAQVLSILALNPKLPLHVAASYMSNTLKVRTPCACMFESLIISIPIHYDVHC